MRALALLLAGAAAAQPMPACQPMPMANPDDRFPGSVVAEVPERLAGGWVLMRQRVTVGWPVLVSVARCGDDQALHMLCLDADAAVPQSCAQRDPDGLADALRGAPGDAVAAIMQDAGGQPLPLAGERAMGWHEAGIMDCVCAAAE